MALIDPDMIFLRPITGVFAPGGYLTSRDWAPGEYWPRIERGRPAGQQYGLGAHWLHFNRSYICGKHSPCARTTAKDAQKHFPVGPPYVLHVDDLKPVRYCLLAASLFSVITQGLLIKFAFVALPVARRGVGKLRSQNL